MLLHGPSSFVFLFLESYGVRKMEAAFAIMVMTMAISFAYMFVDAKPSGKELLVGKQYLISYIHTLALLSILYFNKKIK